jgi:3-oxoacyl-[acyl-carrier-protein] synthase III
LLGESREIDGIPSLQAHPMGLRYLKNFGLRRYSHLGGTVLEACADTSSRCLQSAGLEGRQIGAIVLGLSEALPFGVFINQCTNFSQALLFARHLIHGEGHAHVMLVGSDRLDDGRGGRVMPNNTSVYSDMALSCLVSAERTDGFVVGPICHKFLPQMARIMKNNDQLAFIETYSSGIRAACDLMYERSGRKPSNFDYLITPNFNDSVVKNLARLSGIEEGRLFRDNLATMAHCFAADHMISLRTIADSGKAAKGCIFNLVAVGGFWNFSSTFAKKT